MRKFFERTLSELNQLVVLSLPLHEVSSQKNRLASKNLSILLHFYHNVQQLHNGLHGHCTVYKKMGTYDCFSSITVFKVELK